MQMRNMAPLCRLALGCAILSGAFGPVTFGAGDRRDVVGEIDAVRRLPFPDLMARGRVLLFSLTAQELPIAGTRVLDAPASQVNLALGELVIERWGELDGAAAFKFANARVGSERPVYETAALRGWARKDPRDAWTKLMVISNRGADRRYSEYSVLSAVATTDLSLALELFEDLGSERSCLMCNAELLVSCAMRTGELAVIRRAISGLPAGPTRNALRDAYWYGLGQFAVEDALSLLAAERNPEDAAAARVRIASGWSSRDFAAALDYVLKHYDAADIDAAVLPMIQTWSQGAVPEDVAGVIKKLPTSLSERSQVGVVPLLANVDPAAALDWATTFTNADLRAESLHRGMWRWARADGEAAQAYIERQKSLELRGPMVRSYLLARVSNNTLALPDLFLLNTGFHPDWVSAVLRELSVQLADPSNEPARNFDLNAYQAWIESNELLKPPQRQRALGPLQSNGGHGQSD